MSTEKYRAIIDLFESPELRKEMMLPFYTYHSRWNELKKEDFCIEKNTTKGYKGEIDVCPVSLIDVDLDSYNEIESVGVDYLRHIVDLCDEHDIDILLTYIPFEYNDDTQNEVAFLRHFAEDNEVAYIDGNMLKAILNEKTDYANGYANNSHLNYQGAKKITNYLGQYIITGFDIPNRKGDPAFDDWYEQYLAYSELKHQMLKEAENPETVLMLASDKQLDKLIELNGTAVVKEERFKYLFLNLFPNGDKDMSFINDNMKYIIISADGEISFLAEEGESCLGTIIKGNDPELSNTDYQLLLDGKERYSVEEQDTGEGFRITLVDSLTKEVVFSEYYSNAQFSAKYEGAVSEDNDGFDPAGDVGNS